VPALKPHKTRSTPLAVKLSLGICILLGLLLLVLSNLNSIQEVTKFNHLLQNLLHDLGIAFCVSFAVAGLFEIYRSVRHQLENMRDVIDFVMGEQITADVWMELKELIEVKSVIRRNVKLRLEFERDPALQAHEAILRVEHQYDLFSLREKRTKCEIQHELDYQFKRPERDLPRWDAVVIDPLEARVPGHHKFDPLAERIDIEVALPPRRDNESVFVQTHRRELVNLPGSYNFYTPEFMKGFRLNVINCPPEFEVLVLVRPHGGGQALPNHNHTWSYDPLIFPGQGIEIKFMPAHRPEPSGHVPSSVASSN
jgi:hypothetical protein